MSNGSVPDGQQTPHRSVLRNLAVLGTSELAAKALTAVTLVVVARLLGPHDFGLAATALVVVYFLALVSDGGLNNWTKAQIARRPADASSLIGETILVQGGLALLVTAGAAILSFALPLPDAARPLLLAAAPLMFMQALTTDYALQALERMGQTGIARVSGQLVNAGFSITLVAITRDPIFAVIGVWLGQAVVAIIAARLLTRSGIPIRFTARGWAQVRALMANGLPLLGVTVLIQYTLTFGILYLAGRADPEEVGYVNAVMRLLSLLPAAAFVAGSAALPEMVRRQSGSPRSLSPFLERGMRVTLAFGIPIAGCLSIAAPLIMAIVYGESYTPGAYILAIAAFVVPATALQTLMATALIALDRTVRLMLAQVVTAVSATIGVIVATHFWHVSGTVVALVGAVTLGGIAASVFATPILGAKWMLPVMTDVAILSGLGAIVILAAQILPRPALLPLWLGLVVAAEFARGWPTLQLLRKPKAASTKPMQPTTVEPPDRADQL